MSNEELPGQIGVLAEKLGYGDDKSCVAKAIATLADAEKDRSAAVIEQERTRQLSILAGMNEEQAETFAMAIAAKNDARENQTPEMQHELDMVEASTIKAYWIYPIIVAGCYAFTVCAMLSATDVDDPLREKLFWVVLAFAGATVATIVGFLSRRQIAALKGV